ncbi:MAG: TMEM175 family protein [Rhodobacteraceae bacterium]|nr:TMEM175 family protein [Paracoccaceae bacterium]
MSTGPDLSSERLILFTDAVIAITITLLALEIRPPEGAGGMSDAALGAALVALGPAVLAWLLSFAVVGGFWISHHRKFAFVPRVDGGLVLWNLLFLLAIGAVPFATALIARNPGPLATALYGGVMTAGAALLAAMWLHAGRAGLIDPALPVPARRLVLAGSLAVTGIFALSVPVALVLPDAAKFMWLLVLPVVLWRRQRTAALRGEAP